MNANEIALEFEEYLKEIEELPWGNHQILCDQAATLLRQQQEKLTKYELRHAEQRKRIDELEAYQKHDVELAEAIGWDKGYEAGRQLGMKQERALWELAASTQEIMDTHPVKELTDEEIHQAIRRGFSREDFLSDGIFLEIKELLRKAQEK